MVYKSRKLFLKNERRRKKLGKSLWPSFGCGWHDTNMQDFDETSLIVYWIISTDSKHMKEVPPQCRTGLSSQVQFWKLTQITAAVLKLHQLSPLIDELSSYCHGNADKVFKISPAGQMSLDVDVSTLSKLELVPMISEAENVERVSESLQPSVCLPTRIRGSSPSSCGSSPLNITSTPPPDTCSPGGKKVHTQIQTLFPFQDDSVWNPVIES